MMMNGHVKTGRGDGGPLSRATTTAFDEHGRERTAASEPRRIPSAAHVGAIKYGPLGARRFKSLLARGVDAHARLFVYRRRPMP